MGVWGRGAKFKWCTFHIENTMILCEGKIHTLSILSENIHN